MGLGTTGANALLNGLTGAGAWFNLCTGDPGTTGANEASGGSNARVQITWPSASGGQTDYATTISVSVAAGSYTHWGIWSASSAGSFVVGGKLAKSLVFGGSGTAKITRTTLTAALAS